MRESLKDNPKQEVEPSSKSGGLTQAELTNLQRFLPANLMQSILDVDGALPKSVLSPCVRHLAGLLEATTSHLPASLVRQVRRQPKPGQADGEFVEGTLLLLTLVVLPRCLKS